MIPGVGIPMFMGASGLYQFTTFTFTNCSITGQNGPTLAQMQSAYSATAWTQNTAFFNIGAYQGYQKWTVPKTGTYRFDIAGASGGKNTYADPNDYRGLGARVQADISLVEGEFIIIAVGQSGIIQTYSGGGGGATFIVRLSTPAALLVAGGGGGSYLNSDYRVSHSNASTATSGKTPSGNQTPGGGSGGGGYLGSGANSTSYGSGGGGFNNGLVGGGGYATYAGAGGFGGGGGGEWNFYGSSGGGGGYSGGCNGSGGYGGYAGSNANGGGGSYNIGTASNVTLTAAYNSSHGYATITLL